MFGPCRDVISRIMSKLVGEMTRDNSGTQKKGSICYKARASEY
jgi:hypothetical protein